MTTATPGSLLIGLKGARRSKFSALLGNIGVSASAALDTVLTAW